MLYQTLQIKMAASNFEKKQKKIGAFSIWAIGVGLVISGESFGCINVGRLRRFISSAQHDHYDPILLDEIHAPSRAEVFSKLEDIFANTAMVTQ